MEFNISKVRSKIDAPVLLAFCSFILLKITFLTLKLKILYEGMNDYFSNIFLFQLSHLPAAGHAVHHHKLPPPLNLTRFATRCCLGNVALKELIFSQIKNYHLQ